MIEKTMTVYECEHCGKKLFRKYAMEKHELFCPKNLGNKRPCFGCKFLTQIPTWYYAPHTKHTAIAKETKGFYCQKHQQEMYPPKIEILGYDMEEHKSPMPRQCQDFEEFNCLEI